MTRMVALLLGLSIACGARAVEDFPHRLEFHDVLVYSSDRLSRRYDDTLIVDVRSKFEYDVLRVSKAINIPVAFQTFEKKLSELRSKNSDVHIVFYCNGHDCRKSYLAARRAAQLGYVNVFAYDAGISDWAELFPERSTLLGVAPLPAKKLISRASFHRRVVQFDEFRTLAKEKDTVVIDIRDPIQRNKKIPFRSVKLPLDRFIKELRRGRYKDMKLLIVDAVGEQTRWLQYLLEEKGYESYYFLYRGAANVDI